MTLKTGLGFAQGHWKWHHLIDRGQRDSISLDRVRVPIRLP